MTGLTRETDEVLDMLHEAGYKAYIVGGCVRDMLMGKEPEDYDITTSARPEEIKKVFSGKKTIDTGIAHGTVTVVIDGQAFEITTFRVEAGYSDGRRPDSVSFTGNLKEDAARRDFTMNSIAFNREEGIIDYFGGAADIKAGVIRCVGDPKARFREDGLRIIRAVRFSSVIGFDIEEETRNAALECRASLKNISEERIREELIKFLCGKNVRRQLTANIDILGEVIPELLPMRGFDQKNDHHIYDVLEHTAAVVEAVEAQPRLRLAALFHDIGKPRRFSEDEEGTGHFFGHARTGAEIAEEIMSRLKFDSRSKSDVVTLVRSHSLRIEVSPGAVKRAMNRLTPEIFFDLLKLQRADNAALNPHLSQRAKHYDKLKAMADDIIRDDQCFSLKNLKVNGRDLLRLGVPRGPAIGRILEILLEQVIDGDIPNEKRALLERSRLICEANADFI